MTNQLSALNETRKWRLMVSAAKRGALEAGYKLEKVPGRGLSNVWKLSMDGRTTTTSIRTTRDRWIAFPPLEDGTKWRTLNDVEMVLVATVDNKDNPREIQVYLFEAREVQKRFDAAYSARVRAGQTVRDNFGMWINLDSDDRKTPSSVGSGLVKGCKPIAVFSLSSLIEEEPSLEPSTEEEPATEEERSRDFVEGTPSTDDAPLSIAEAKRRLARTLGVDPSAIRITVEA